MTQATFLQQVLQEKEPLENKGTNTTTTHTQMMGFRLALMFDFFMLCLASQHHQLPVSLVPFVMYNSKLCRRSSC